MVCYWVHLRAAFWRSIQVHGSMYPRRDSGEASAQKEAREKERGKESEQSRRCTGTSKGPGASPGAWEAQTTANETTADATRAARGSEAESASPPVYMHKPRSVYVGDFVCSRVRRVGAFKRRIRFSRVSDRSDCGKSSGRPDRRLPRREKLSVVNSLRNISLLTLCSVKSRILCKI